jgi:hypothetical protein
MLTARRRRPFVPKWIVPLLCLLAWAVVPLAPMGASRAVAQELELETDARLEGYGTDKVVIEEGSTAMTWVGFTILCLIALLGMFKDAKRTHLD